MNRWTRRLAFALSILGVGVVATQGRGAWEEKKLVGTYRLTQRVASDGKERKGPPEVLGSMTFTKTRRTIIMKWVSDNGTPVSIARIATYTLSGGTYCEGVDYGVQSNLGAPGVSYDTPSTAPACTAAISDAIGLAFDVPAEKVRFQITHDGILATSPSWTDHWERVK